MGFPSSILPIVFTRNIFTCFQWFFQWPKWVLYLQHSCATSMYHLASCWPFGIQRGSNRPESPRKTIPKWWKEDMLELVLVEGNGMNVSLWSTCFQQLNTTSNHFASRSRELTCSTFTKGNHKNMFSISQPFWEGVIINPKPINQTP